MWMAREALSMAEDERTAVKTYVPGYQKEIWRDHAESLGMSQSEFVRTMVQAGRREFDVPTVEEGRSPTADPGGGGLEDRVLEVLSDGDPTDWERLRETLAADLEERLEETLDDLQDANRVRYSGREGGYVLTDE